MRKKRIATFIGVVLFVFVWSALLYKFHPEELVELIGLRNGYIAGFFIGVFGAAATFSFISVYPAIITLAAGGWNPIILGLVVGVGMTIGNLIYFYLGQKGKDVLAEKYEKRAERLLKWVEEHPCWLVEIVIFVYVGFTPFSNNLLTIFGGITGMRFRTVFVPLLLGNIFLATWFAYLTVLGISIF